MHCKFFGVFAYCLSFLFSFFSSACEFQLIKRIGAHGKQNPDFIIISIRWFLFNVDKITILCTLYLLPLCFRAIFRGFTVKTYVNILLINSRRGRKKYDYYDMKI